MCLRPSSTRTRANRSATYAASLQPARVFAVVLISLSCLQNLDLADLDAVFSFLYGSVQRAGYTKQLMDVLHALLTVPADSFYGAIARPLPQPRLLRACWIGG